MQQSGERMASKSVDISGVSILAPLDEGYQSILSKEAVGFVAALCQRYTSEVHALLARRSERQAFFDQGGLPDFLPETEHVRNSDWRVAPIPEDLQDRRVEITGPVDRKMIINALNANVKCFMADFEDSLSPTWNNIVQGQINLRDAVNRSIDFVSEQGKAYCLQDHPAVLICRPRGWHLFEKHITVDGRQVPGALMDFGLYVFHNAQALLDQGSGPYFYLPKLQSHLEARLWNEIMDFSEQYLGLEHGVIKATILIETLPAVFEMNEILYEMRDHIVALNCGRWDYIFSYIKTLRKHSDRIQPDRTLVGMDKPFLDAYSRLLIKTCHRRGALAMGGMAAFIPIKGDEGKNAEALSRVRMDKEREASNGHDGTWVAHPGLAGIAMEVFDHYIGEGKKNQLAVLRESDTPISAEDLLAVSDGDVTEVGLRSNIRVAVRYIEAWLRGQGCVPLYNLMEDAATAEISRTQIWQWIHHKGITLENEREVDSALFRQLLDEELNNIKGEVGEETFSKGKFSEASKIMDQITTAPECVDFLTLVGYDYIP